MGMDEYFGEPGYGSSEFFKTWKLREPDIKKGEQETRITRRLFGPMKSFLREENGQWYQYFALHYGFQGINSKDPSKLRMRPFGCLFRDDRVTHEELEKCEQCDNVEAHEVALEAAEVAYKSEKRTEASIKELLRPQREWLRRFNRDGKYYFCAMDPATEEYGVLLLTAKAKNKLLALRTAHDKKYPKQRMLPPREGVLVEFVRTGTGFEINDEPHVVEEEKTLKLEDGGVVTTFVPKPAPLTEAQAKKAFQICPDLSPAAQEVVKFLSHEQVRALVACSGDPEEVDRIWGQGTTGGRRMASRREESQESASVTPVKTKTLVTERPKAEEKEEPKAEEKEEPAEETDEQREERELTEQMAALQEKKRLRAAAAVAAAEQACLPAKLPDDLPDDLPPLTPHEDYTGLSNDEFLKRFGR